jgi:hypothetical protein
MTTFSNGYFTLDTNCTNDLTISNTVTNEILYTSSPPTTLLFTAQLNRFVFPTIQLVGTHNITEETALFGEVSVYDIVNGN